jgi:predicted aspartyl protease
VGDALVDTGATMLSMPGRLIRQLGLSHVRARQARTSAGPVTVQIYGTVRLTIQGRDCPSDVTEVPDDCAVLIGQVPLELLDFVVDPAGRRLIGNPEHGGEHVVELY